MSEAAAPPQPPIAPPVGAPAPVAAVAAPSAPAAPPSVHVHLPQGLLAMARMQPDAQLPLAPAAPAAPKAEEPPAAKSAESPVVAAKPDDTAALSQRLADLEAKHRATLIRAEVDRVSAVAGAIDPAMVHALIAGDLDVTADGKVIVKGDARTTGEQHIARYLAGKAFLLKPLVPGGGAGSPSTLQPPGAAPVLDMSSNAGATALARSFAVSRGFLPPPRA